MVEFAFCTSCWRACVSNKAEKTSDGKSALCAVGAALAVAAPLLVLGAAPVSAAGGVLSTNTELRRVVATDSVAILQHALPLPAEVRGEDAPPVRAVQTELERLALCTRARGGAARQLNARAAMLRLNTLLSERRLDLLLDVPASRRSEAARIVGNLERSVSELSTALAITESPSALAVFPTKFAAFAGAVVDSLDKNPAADAFDGPAAEAARQDAVRAVGDLELLMMDGAPFPYRIPRRYDALPRLLGRATLEFTVTKGGNSGETWRNRDGTKAGRDAKLTVVLDGYSAPLTAGAFMERAQRGQYDGAPVISTQAGFCIRLGERGKSASRTASGSVSAAAEEEEQALRRVPFEILIEGERAPIYGATLDEAGVGDLQPALPVTAYGAVALEHALDDPNADAGTWVMLDIDPRSYTARALGGSVLTGSLSAFGYVTDSAYVLPQMTAGDSIRACRVVSGEQNYRSHA